MRYDAVIVGAGFAGLAVASRLRGKVALIDRKPIGTGQTSACGTMLNVLQRVGCLDSTLQVYHRGFIHTMLQGIRYRLSYPFCAFDYGQFCWGMLRHSDAEVFVARVQGLDGDRVVTDRGDFQSDCIVDASGWRAVLASFLKPGFADRRALSFGLESVVAYRGEGIHFWVDPRLIRYGVAWLFPCGAYSRVGIGSYRGAMPSMKGRLAGFAAQFGRPLGCPHGGFFPWRLREPTVGRVFVVGDAAGQCLPLTGEGIRPAIYYGQRLGEILQGIVDGDKSLAWGLAEYRSFVLRHAKYYAFLESVQQLLAAFPNLPLTLLLVAASVDPASRYILRCYERLAPLTHRSGP